MAETPPPRLAAYPRERFGSYGAADRLQALADGYVGLARVLGLAVTAVLLGGAATAIVGGFTDIVSGYTVAALIGLAIWSLLPFEKIGIGLGWSGAVIVGLGVALGLTFIPGTVISVPILLIVAARVLKEVGVLSGFCQLKRADVEVRVAELRAEEGRPFPPTTPPTD